jgi:hypothetical protein
VSCCHHKAAWMQYLDNKQNLEEASPDQQIQTYARPTNLSVGKHALAPLHTISFGNIAAGMIPLARELIKNGTFVVLAANEVPALNDITAAELKVLLKDCGKIDKLLGRAVDEQVITVVSSGSALPIIDLTKVRSIN